MSGMDNYSVFSSVDTFIWPILISNLDPISIVTFLSVNKQFLSNSYLWNLAAQELSLTECLQSSHPDAREKILFAGI